MKSIHGEVGNRLRQYRKRIGLSQEKLALKAGITVSFLGEIERGIKKPSIESLEKLLNAMNISFCDFFDFEAEIKPIKDCTNLERLVIELKTRPMDEIALVYEIVRRILEYSDYRSMNHPE